MLACAREQQNGDRKVDPVILEVMSMKILLIALR
jgi:hypothetical protein